VAAPRILDWSRFARDIRRITRTPKRQTARNEPMPRCEIEQCQSYVSKYWFDADSQPEAIPRIVRLENEPVDDSLEYVETAEDIGSQSMKTGNWLKN
jgi:hypothetical protein